MFFSTCIIDAGQSLS